MTEPDRNSLWNGSPDDCDNRGHWISHRLTQDSTPIDVAFLGTSRTINGIQDTLISRILSEEAGYSVNAVNLGYCRFGSDLMTVIMRDLVNNKKPKLIVIEVNEEMSVNSHPMFPYYATGQDLRSPATFVNQAVPANFYNGFLARLGHFRNQAFNFPQDTTSIGWNHEELFGYRGYPESAPPSELQSAVRKSSRHSPVRELEIVYPKQWLNRTLAIAGAAKIQVVFLYTPSFSGASFPSEGMNFYTQHGKLYSPEQNFREPSMWRDKDHFNDKGANEFSSWVAKQIADLVK
jgi:hypothetical protein